MRLKLQQLAPHSWSHGVKLEKTQAKQQSHENWQLRNYENSLENSTKTKGAQNEGKKTAEKRWKVAMLARPSTLATVTITPTPLFLPSSFLLPFPCPSPSALHSGYYQV